VSAARTDKRTARQAGLTLIELLSALSIMAVVSGMIVLSWATLTQSYGSSVKSNKSREYARDAVRRMTREIRDMQRLQGAPAIREASATALTFTTSFNREGNDDPTLRPRLVRYYLEGGSLYRMADTVDPITGLGDGSLGDETGRLVVPHVVNVLDGATTPLFVYTYFAADGTIQTTTTPTVSQRNNVASVQLRLRTDLNPGRSPEYFELTTTTQPRNLRY
jgi:prepilin-type N-terminal cleavage/methylation domain-containing protein